MAKILWTLQHNPTKEQLEQLSQLGEVHYLSVVYPELFNKLKDTPPDIEEQVKLAEELYALCLKYDKVVLPIGSPSFQFIFAYITCKKGKKFKVLYSHTRRMSREIQLEDGTVKKETIFQHEKFLEF